tara:strand:+ start:526 stop:1068 length:543 start_codon:yes stop_codon:yes gene_type:complete
MKTIKLLFFTFLFFTITVNAQITKGNWMVGGDIAFSYSKTKPKSIVEARTFNMDISPNIGYFFWDKLAFGTKVNYTISRYRSNSGDSDFDRLLVSPFVRYYFLETEKPTNVFLESSYRFAVLNENNSTEFSIKGGAAIFLNSSVAFEIALEYLNSNANNTFVGENTLLLGFGVQIHLERR